MVGFDAPSQPVHPTVPVDPAERTSFVDLQREAEACLAHPVARFLLQSMDGLVLILDEQRRVLATNELAQQFVDPLEAPLLGLRPGELFGCSHVPEGPSGCGTSQACKHCGLVCAVLEAQHRGVPVHAEGLFTLRQGGLLEAAEFDIVASPLVVGPHRFLAVVLHDLSATKRKEALERLFFHDVSNLMQGIRGWADLLVPGPEYRQVFSPYQHGLAQNQHGLAQKLTRLIDLLDRELKSHRAMAQAENGQLKPSLRPILPMEILQDVGDLLRQHALAAHRHLAILPTQEPLFHTDPELLSRVLLNMALNAVEVSLKGETITLSVVPEGSNLCFQVHNPGEMPEELRSRIFQRSFSTKAAAGRGLGTYAMKLFGERVLQGQVGFDTGPEGTRFWIQLAR